MFTSIIIDNQYLLGLVELEKNHLLSKEDSHKI
jgi:hypothetical protein